VLLSGKRVPLPKENSRIGQFKKKSDMSRMKKAAKKRVLKAIAENHAKNKRTAEAMASMEVESDGSLSL
jgi:hypothetical protein